MPQMSFKLPGGFPSAVSDVPTDAQVLTFNDSNSEWDAQDAGGGGGGFDTVYKTADETINNDSTLTDDTDLQFSVDANASYAMICLFMYAADAIPDFKYAYSVPAGITGNIMDGYFNSQNTSAVVRTWATSRSPIDSSGNVRALFNTGCLNIEGTAGTIAFQWAQNTSNAGNTTLKEGSYIMFKKLT